MDILIFFGGALFGFGLTFAFFKSRESERVSKADWELKTNLLEQKNLEWMEAKTKLENTLHNLNEAQSEINQLHHEKLQLTSSFSEYKNKAEMLDRQLTEQKEMMVKMKDEMSKDFELIAQKILQEKADKFENQNKTQLDIILNPFKEKIDEFRTKFDTNEKQSIESRAQLQAHIKSLTDLNVKMSDEANKLSQALQGNKKIQGNWGEMILENLLETSGLQKDKEYSIQYTSSNDENEVLRPDVIINLPEEKHIIIDCKVSLNNYNAYVNAETNEERIPTLKLFIENIKTHIKQLSDKKYYELKGINSQDFVMMYIPIEAAYIMALQQDSNLFQFAFDRKIILVSNTSLFSTLRVVANMWKNEKQNKNVQDIVRLGNNLYEKLQKFVEEYLILGTKIDKLKTDYAENARRLTEGPANVIKTAMELKAKGLPTDKKFHPSLEERATQNDLLNQ